MRIIKHGDQYEIGQAICDTCKCEFAYTSKDIFTERVCEYDDGTYGRDYINQDFVRCPECHKNIAIPQAKIGGIIGDFKKSKLYME